jgi:hypothetical protein
MGCLDLLICLIMSAVAASLSYPFWAHLPRYLQHLALVLSAAVGCIAYIAFLFITYKLAIVFGRYKTMGKPSDENKRVPEE